MQWERIQKNQNKILPLSLTYIFVHTIAFFLYEFISFHLEFSSGNLPDNIILSLIDIFRTLRG